jgi:FSR family fosmidomycin resistance protein-like MFS transporter
MKKQVLLSASLFHALNDAATVVVPMTLPLLYSQKFLITRYAQIGLLSNLGLMTSLVFQMVVAHWADHVEYKKLLAASCLGLTASMALMTTARTFAGLLLFHILMRIFNSFYHPLGISLVSKSHKAHELDQAMGIQSASGNVGVFLAFISMGFLAQALGWRRPLLIWAAAGLLLGILSYLAVRRVPTPAGKTPLPKVSRWLKTAGAIKDFIPGFIYGGAGWGVTVYFAPSLFNHRFGVPLGQTGLYLALWIGGGSVVAYFFGWLSSRLGRRTASLVSMVGSAVTLAVIGLAPRNNLALAGLILFGVFLSLIYPAMQSYVGNKVEGKDQALAFSLVSNIQVLSGALVVLLAGFLSDRFGIHTPFLLMAGLGVLLSAFYWFRTPRD